MTANYYCHSFCDIIKINWDYFRIAYDSDQCILRCIAFAVIPKYCAVCEWIWWPLNKTICLSVLGWPKKITATSEPSPLRLKHDDHCPKSHINTIIIISEYCEILVGNVSGCTLAVPLYWRGSRLCTVYSATLRTRRNIVDIDHFDRKPVITQPRYWYT